VKVALRKLVKRNDIAAFEIAIYRYECVGWTGTHECPQDKKRKGQKKFLTPENGIRKKKRFLRVCLRKGHPAHLQDEL